MTRGPVGPLPVPRTHRDTWFPLPLPVVPSLFPIISPKNYDGETRRTCVEGFESGRATDFLFSGHTFLPTLYPLGVSFWSTILKTSVPPPDLPHTHPFKKRRKLYSRYLSLLSILVTLIAFTYIPHLLSFPSYPLNPYRLSVLRVEVVVCTRRRTHGLHSNHITDSGIHDLVLTTSSVGSRR